MSLSKFRDGGGGGRSGGHRALMKWSAAMVALAVLYVTLDSSAPLEPSKVRAVAPSLAVDWQEVGAEATGILQGLLAIRSVNPPGAEEPAARYLAKICEREGIEHQVIETAPGRALLMARLSGKRRTGALCLTNHLDVVPPQADEWSDPSLAFSGKIVDGRIYGRGALDMKGFAVMQLMALVVAKRAKLTLERDLVYLALPDEEAGGRQGAWWVCEQRPELLDGITCMWNEGGVGVTDLGGMVRPVFALMHAERGALWLSFRARGPSGHGSSAPPGSAPGRLLEALERLFDEQPSMRLGPITRRQFATMADAADFPSSFFLRRAGNPLLRPLLDRTFKKDRFLRAVTRNTRSLTVLSAGEKVNVIPPLAEARVDIRLLPGVRPEDMRARLEQRLAGLDIEIEVLHSQEASASPVGTPLFDIIRGTIERLHPDAVVAPLLSPGGTDSAAFRSVGIDCYGLIPALFTREEMKGFHGADEHIRVEALTAGARATFEAAIGYSQRP